MTTPTPESLPPAPHLDAKGWSFWRLRLARALLAGGLVLAAVRLLPAYPHEQHLLFTAPSGASISALNVVWRSSDDGAPLGGANLRPPTPASRLSHRIKVPNGQYTFEITAKMLAPCEPPLCEPSSQSPTAGVIAEHSFERVIDLAGDTTRVSLNNH